jgi:hypothetical protein
VLDCEPRGRGYVDDRSAFAGTAVEVIAGARAGTRRGTYCVPAGFQVVEDTSTPKRPIFVRRVPSLAFSTISATALSIQR